MKTRIWTSPSGWRRSPRSIAVPAACACVHVLEARGDADGDGVNIKATG